MLESLGRSRAGMRLALGVGRAMPRRAGHRLAGFAADRMMATDGPTVRAARSNQYVVSGCSLGGEALEAATRANVRSMARTLYDLYHVIGRPAEKALFARDGVVDAFLERDRAEGPFVYVGVHLGNFDLVGRQLGFEGWTPQILSVPTPHEGYEWQNHYREQAGFAVTPVSLETLKVAARRLEAGGSLLTGLDRPMDEPDKARPLFFGLPAQLPLLHVRLAMRAGVGVIVMTAPRTEDGRYRLVCSDPIRMEGDRPTPEALARNAERCLSVAEGWISAYRDQWAMPHPVWPDVQVPER